MKLRTRVVLELLALAALAAGIALAQIEAPPTGGDQVKIQFPIDILLFFLFPNTLGIIHTNCLTAIGPALFQLKLFPTLCHFLPGLPAPQLGQTHGV